LSLRRWYLFTRKQGRVARRLPRVITVSQSSRADIVKELRVPANRVAVVPNGVDTELFRPLPGVARKPGRIVTTASADVPLKGLVFLVEALAKIRTERDADLVVVGSVKRSGQVMQAIDRFGVADAISFRSDLEWDELVRLYAEAEVAVVPSLYEGFSLPAIEAMACGLPLVATTAGALPEVTGAHDEAAVLVPPGDATALASELLRLLADEGERARLGKAARRRVQERFSWRSTAEATVAEYNRVIRSC
jgi:glycosyltransferase involved in cell wall biosynthesis